MNWYVYGMVLYAHITISETKDYGQEFNTLPLLLCFKQAQMSHF